MVKPIDPFEKTPTLEVARSILSGRKHGKQRATRQTPAEQRRISATWSARIGDDIKSEIQELVSRTGRDNGYIGRALLRYALDALERGDLVINAQNEIVPNPRKSERNANSKAPGALGCS